MGELRSAVEAVAAVDPDELDDVGLSALLVEVSRQRDRLDAVCLRLIRAQDRRTAWKSDGAHSQKHWLAEHCRLSLGQASRQAETAKRLAALPQTAQAVADGTIGMGQAQVAAAAVRDLGAEAAEGLERAPVGGFGGLVEGVGGVMGVRVGLGQGRCEGVMTAVGRGLGCALGAQR